MDEPLISRQQVERLQEDIKHHRRVIAWLLTGHRTQDGAVPTVEIPYRALDDMFEHSVLVRRHHSNNNVVEYSLYERADVLEL